MASTSANVRGANEKACDKNYIVFRFSGDGSEENPSTITNEGDYNNIIFLYMMAKELVKRKHLHPEVKKVLKKHITLYENGGALKIINNEVEYYIPITNQEMDEVHHEFHGIMKYIFKTDLAPHTYVKRFLAFEHFIREVNSLKCPCCVKEGRA